MIAKFVWWFIVFALSFLAQNAGMAAQGTAFFYIHFGVQVIILAIFALLFFIAGDDFATKIEASSVVIIFSAIALALVLFLPWVISKLFNVDFFLAYQIVSFISCVFNNGSKK